MLRVLAVAWLLSCAFASPGMASEDTSREEISEQLSEFDTGTSGELEFAELVEYLYRQDIDKAREVGFSERRLRALAEDWAADILSITCNDLPCASSIEDIATELQTFEKSIDISTMSPGV